MYIREIESVNEHVINMGLSMDFAFIIMKHTSMISMKWV